MSGKENFSRPWSPYALELLVPNTKILDLGSGMAEFARLAKNQKQCEVYCIDIVDNHVKHARKLGFKSFKVDLNQEKLPFKDKFFDGAVALEVIEHILNTEHLLSEANRVLKIGGYLIISTPNVAWIGHRIRSLLGYPPHDEGYHVRFFTKRMLESEPAKHGFQIERWNSFTGSIKISIWQSLLAFAFCLRARKVERGR